MIILFEARRTLDAVINILEYFSLHNSMTSTRIYCTSLPARQKEKKDNEAEKEDSRDSKGAM